MLTTILIVLLVLMTIVTLWDDNAAKMLSRCDLSPGNWSAVG